MRKDTVSGGLRPWMFTLICASLALMWPASTAKGQEGTTDDQTAAFLYAPSRLVSSGATPAPVAQVTLRKFPYPYRAMLSLTSDADGMTLRKFVLIHRFLNTDERTPLGLGLGLDVGDSFFFFIGTDRPGLCDTFGTTWKDQMSYFHRLSTTDLHDASAIITFARAGWIDSLHGLGDFSMEHEQGTLFDRRFAVVAAKELSENHLRFAVWINHGNRSNVENFGSPESPYQKGDIPGSPYRVTDLMIPAGVHFVWTRRDSDFGRKSMLYPIVLRDGHKLWGFYRYTDDGYTKDGDLRWNWNPRKLGLQLSASHMQELEHRGEYAMVSQHLGGDAADFPFYGDNLTGLVRLMHEYKHGRILVARTSRLLRYHVSEQFLQYQVEVHAGRIGIHALRIADPVLGTHVPTLAELRGITFYTQHPGQTDLYIGRARISDSEIVRNPKDQTGTESIGIRWWPSQTADISHTLPQSMQSPAHRMGPPTTTQTRIWPEIFSWSNDAV